jgi:hypothetical protein
MVVDRDVTWVVPTPFPGVQLGGVRRDLARRRNSDCRAPF